MIGAKCKYKTNFYIDLILFFLNNQEMWVSESFLCALSVIQLIKSSTKPEPRLYVHIWQNNHQIYKGNHVSLVVGCLPWWYWQDLYIVTISGKIITILDTAFHHCQSCQHYNNYYTLFYIQQVINKLKVISAVCVVKEHV